MNPKIGTIHADGSLTFPSETLAGAPYERGDFDPMPPIVHTLDAVGHFAVGDVWPPLGFDAHAALDALKAELAAAHAPRKAEAKP